FTYKEELRGKPWVLLSVPKSELTQVHVSTGTTSKKLGDHIYTLYSWDDIYLNELAIEMPLMVHSLKEDIVVNSLPYEMSSAGMAFHRSFQHGSGAAVVNVGKGGFYSDPKKTLIILKDIEATVFLTTPPYALYLSELAEEMGIDIKKDLKLKYIWLTGEGCSFEFRKRLEKIWGCKCYMYYGSLECGPLGVECYYQNGYHIPEGHVFIEIIDPKTGKVLPPGMIGEVCVTVLYRKASPLIRFRVEDLGYIDKETCDCCMERPKIFLRGREKDQIKVGEKFYSPYYLEEMLYKIPEVGNNYQFVVSNEGLTIRVELARGVENPEKVAKKIKTSMSYYVGDIYKVIIEDKIERTLGKTERVKYI
ncbi:MAG: hypothetical protein A2086_16120, partial [Spirochaetes bacterium GWD1_27_9]